jgi:transposase-like protein
MRSTLSYEEKQEIHAKIILMVEHGYSAVQIAEEVGVDPNTVWLACKKNGLKIKSGHKEARALTKDELKYYRECRKRNEPISHIADKMGISKKFLKNLEDYLKIRPECKDCHALVKNLKGKYDRYCAKCKKKRQGEQEGNSKRKRYRNDPIFRAKIIQMVKKYRKK